MGKRKYFGGSSHATNMLRTALRGANLAKRAYNAYSGGTATSTRNNKRAFISTGVTTAHHDQKLKYRYKRMPKRKRRRYVRRVKFVKHALSTELPKFKYTFHEKTNVSIALNKQAMFARFSAFGIPAAGAAISTGGTHYNPVVNAWQHMSGFADATLPDVVYAQKWRQLSHTQNISITNYGSTTVLLDIYRVVCRKTFSNATYITPETTNGKEETALMLKMGDSIIPVNIAEDTIGVTPFQMGPFTTHFKILQVKEVQLPAGDTTTLSFRDPKNRYLSMHQLIGKVFMKGMTQGYVFRAKALPSTSAGDNPATSLGVETEFGTVCQKIDPTEGAVSTTNK